MQKGFRAWKIMNFQEYVNKYIIELQIQYLCEQNQIVVPISVFVQAWAVRCAALTKPAQTKSHVC